MTKHWIFIVFVSLSISLSGQTPDTNKKAEKETTLKVSDTTKSTELLKQIGNGFFPTKIWNFDLRYLVKFNQYEGFRTGLGGVTNDSFSKRFRIDSYLVYGFADHRFKYKIGGGVLLNPETKTWLNVSYNDDLQETGSSTFLTDGRMFSFFEPRLLNIELFHKHITSAVSVEHEINPNLYTETEFAVSNVEPTYNYSYILNGQSFEQFDMSTAKVSLQWNPFSEHEVVDGKTETTKDGFPKFSLQYTKNFKNAFDANFNFSKLDFKAVHKIIHKNSSYSTFRLSAGIARGDTPITHLYHAYPNNNNKETILQRFSVAGINSFETMYFNEFFSDRFTTLIVKHYVKPFKIFKGFNPQLVLITRYAVGDMKNIDRHQNITFNTLDKGYTESGFELNKLIFGFGLSFAYRYGGYHLPNNEDNMAFKFTFNISL